MRGRSLGVLWVALSASCAAQSRAPVLVELFTSEGCSSCPPADRLLQQLDPQVIVLSEHVDYWNQQGWKDPFSSASNTARQEAYGRLFRIESVYTPQIVVDGEAQFSGNDGSHVAAGILKASQLPKAEVHLSRDTGGLHVRIASSPAPGDVFVATAADTGDADVKAGENAGRHLHHVAVLMGLRKIGSVKKGADFEKTIELPAHAAEDRIIVFVQQPGPGRISGVALLQPGA